MRGESLGPYTQFFLNMAVTPQIGESVAQKIDLQL